MQFLTRISALALTIALAAPGHAQDAAPATGQGGPGGGALPENAIIVTGERIRGEVETEVPPVVELDEDDIAAYGADSLADLVEQLATQTGSASGRGSGRPVFLVNGR
ncbi:MAG TPA: hypothetical protein DFK13_05540, partial [Erythrobacter sp.]|nr:hypothetical protein [Erythrobacter sp.]